MRILSTILLGLLAVLFTTAAVFLAVDGNLARLTGWYHYRPGDPLFSAETTSRLADVSWIRIQDLHDTIICERDENGVWWIVKPFRDRMSQEAVEEILLFTLESTIVDTLPLNHIVRENMREFGVETMPHTITLKAKNGHGSLKTVARYTLGSASPWLADAQDGKNLLPTTYLRTNFYGHDKRIHVVTGNILGLFRNGLPALRDSHPLLLDPDALRRITISTTGAAPVVLTRASAEVDWVVSAPVVTSADQGQALGLVSALTRLNALRVDDAQTITLPDQPEHVITLESDEGGQPVELSLYKPFFSEQDDHSVCYATVSGRPVVFTLRAAPKVDRNGAYATIIQNVYQLPVLDKQALSHVLAEVVYTRELPLSIDKLRSMCFANVDLADVGSVALRRKKSDARFFGDRSTLLLELVPGNADGGIDDAWLVTTEGRTREAETDVVRQFIGSLKDVPAMDVVADIQPGKAGYDVISRYGLNDPTYILMVAPRPCAFKAVLYGQELPLIRSREPRAFLVNRYKDPQTGESMWVGMEDHGSTIFRLSTKLTRLFSLDMNRWRERNLLSFPLSALRQLTLGFQRAPLVLGYDYIGESWTGTLGGKDITPNINPNRASYYARQLQRLKVRQWLPSDDPDALDALENPVFTVKLDLEITDYSDVHETVIDSSTDLSSISSEEIDRWLLEEDETGQTMRDLALKDRATHKVTRTIEIAPMDLNSDTPLFYGRIKETGDVFILNYNDAQGLGSNPLDM